MTGSSSARTERASLSGAATLSQGRTHYRVKAVHMYIQFFAQNIQDLVCTIYMYTSNWVSIHLFEPEIESDPHL